MRSPRDKTWTYILFLNKLNEKIFSFCNKNTKFKRVGVLTGEQSMPLEDFPGKYFCFFTIDC